MTDDSGETIPSIEPVNDGGAEASEVLRSLGITAHEQITYEWNGYRYTNAKDAIAAARRASR